MKHIFFTVPFILFLFLHINAQTREFPPIDVESVNFTIGKTFSDFMFKGPNGRYNTMGLSGNTYSLSAGIDLGKVEYLHWIRPELTYYEVNARSLFENVATNWEMKYLGMGVSYLLEVVNKERFCLSPGININLSYMTRGQQSVGDLTYNLRQERYFSLWNFQAGPLLNSRLEINKKLALFLEYRFAFGLNQIEKDVNEKTRIFAHFASLGFTYKF
jgi:hypothetical protein